MDYVPHQQTYSWHQKFWNLTYMVYSHSKQKYSRQRITVRAPFQRGIESLTFVEH